MIMNSNTLYMTEETLKNLLRLLQDSDETYDPVRVTRSAGQMVVKICGMDVKTEIEDKPTGQVKISGFFKGDR